MRKKVICGLFCSAVLFFCFPFTTSVIAASPEDEVLQVEYNFVKAHNTNDYDLMCSLYWKSPETSSFVPPQDNAFLIEGFDEIENIWKFLNEFPEGAFVISLHHPKATMIKDDVAVITSYHHVSFTNQSTNEQSVDYIRHTVIVQKIEGKWLIVHDHGSNCFLPNQ